MALSAWSASAENSLPPELHGLWVDSAERECHALRQDEDAYGMGESAAVARVQCF